MSRRILAVAIFILASCGDNLRPQQPDGGEPDAPPDAPPDGPPPVEITCATLPAVTGTCEVTTGNATKLLEGIVLTPQTVYRGGQVAVNATGQITCVGCDCATGGETVITCPDAAISPGLINTHDHITFTQNLPYTDVGVRYEHRHQWRRGQDGKPEITAPGGASADHIRWGELRFLMGGATSIVGSGGQAGLLRNLDSSTNQEGLGQNAVFFDTFPLDDSGGSRRTGDCNYGGTPTTAADIANEDSYEPHTSEGIDGTARNEFLCQSSTRYDTTAPGVSNNLMVAKTAMIHAIGLHPADLGAMATAGTALIWSPRSNITLYGDTARVTAAARLGVEIALGTDWMPTGSMNMLRELRCADSLNKTYFNNQFTDAQLFQMVTSAAASVTATDDVIGALAPGKTADIAIFKANGGKSYRAVFEAEPQDVVLVMRGGKVLYGDATAVAALATGCDAVDVCGTGKQVCLMDEIGTSYSALETAVGAIYPAFSCTAPANEPSCVPARPTSANGSTIYTGVVSATDSDGDGIANSSDKCPMVFDPVRPVDNGAQGDHDGDGMGDACDVCPLDANTMSCTPVDPNDRDHDGVPNTTDNCPDTANPNQADMDSDGKGDVCDVCPNDNNPGSQGCPATIYSIKDGTTPIGRAVRVTNALVTGRGSNGFFVQTKLGDAGYLGADYSGMFVFTGAGAPTLANATLGARVTIDGTVANFFGQLELDQVSAVIVEAVGPEAPPAPEPVTYAEVKTGGTRAMQLEGVIVSLGMASVTATNMMFGEFTLTSGADDLIVDDFLFATPLPSVGQVYTSVRGIIAFRNDASKLEPRDATDLTLAAPTIASFSPALSFARVGETTDMPTFPSPLTVTLSGPAQGDTTITLMSGSADLVVPASVTVPDGMTSIQVPVTAVTQNAAVTVMAQLGVQMVMADVRVLGAGELPATVTLTPATSTIAPGGMVQFTVTLDIPAPAGGTQVDLSVNPAASGTLPANVVVAANQLTASFTYTDTTGNSATVTATLGGSTSNATVTVSGAVNHLVISQVYGGGGNSGATFTNDFIELFNPSGAAIDVTGMSVQYASSTGGTWQVTTLPSVMIPPGGYLLVQEAAGANMTTPLPTPDVMGTIAMAAGSGKIALSSGTAALTGTCPTATVIDFVGYGTANCFEGAAATGALSNSTAAIRAAGGCSDTNNNAGDFAVAAPTPRNSATTPAPCP